jgi:hypothetical protein
VKDARKAEEAAAAILAPTFWFEKPESKRENNKMRSSMKALNITLGLLSLIVLIVGPAVAAPKGITEAGKLLFKFNVLSKPGGWTDLGNACNGARIFFTEGNGQTLGTISWSLDPTVQGFKITDCNGTDGAASVLADESVNFIVAIRVLGPKTSALNLVCSEVNPTIAPGEDLCIIDNGTIKKGSSFTRVMQNIADNEFESVLWSLSGDWKIFDVRVYEWIR